MHIRSTGDPRAFLGAARRRLVADPVRHNVHLSLAAALADDGREGRFWWADADGEVTAVAMQTEPDLPLSLGPGDGAAASALATAIAVDVPDLGAVIGPASDAATFAGTWASLRSTPARPVEGQRTYRCDDVVLPGRATPGAAREAQDHDAGLLVAWCSAFAAETGGSLGGDLEALVDGILTTRSGWVWIDDETPVAMARATTPAHGVTRVGIVYTPPEQRGRGFAEALVASVTAARLAGGAQTAMLFTQLHNPTSNAIYQRVGYRVVDELLHYRFG